MPAKDLFTKTRNFITISTRTWRRTDMEICGEWYWYKSDFQTKLLPFQISLHQHLQQLLWFSTCVPPHKDLWIILSFHNGMLIIYLFVASAMKQLWSNTDDPMQEEQCKRNTKLTIIFSKRSMISFSERFMERSSKSGWGTGSSVCVERGSVGCCMRGFSFFIPVFLKLVIRSRWKKTERLSC